MSLEEFWNQGKQGLPKSRPMLQQEPSPRGPHPRGRDILVGAHPEAEEGAGLTFSRRAFCQSRNIIMYVLSRAPNEVKKCWIERDNGKKRL